MPYAFAHPAAIIPVARWMGPQGVPSALAIGSIVPDAWYFVPLLDRSDSHGPVGLLLFCLPLSLLLYVAFHALFKEPLLALCPPALSSKLSAFGVRGLPRAPWTMVVACLLIGGATHQAWDAFTHEGELAGHARILSLPLYRILQHASTLLGGAFVAFWVWQAIRRAPSVRPLVEPLTSRWRRAAVAALVAAPALAFGAVILEYPHASGTMPALRDALRAAAVIAASALGFAALALSLAYRLRVRGPRDGGPRGADAKSERMAASS